MDLEGKPSLKEKILDLKRKMDREPVDAILDQQGYIMPAYNGLRINVEKSLINMLKGQQWEDALLVYEECAAQVYISDLPPGPIFIGPDKPMVSFMVNVAWGNENIPAILELMAKAQCKSTFFLQGEWTYTFSNLARKILNEGHEIGSHAYTHPDMRGMTKEYIEWELQKTNEVINKELGLKPMFFTPPSGAFDDRVVRIAANEGMLTVLSTIDTQDWKRPAPEFMVQQVKAKIKNGSIILIHPTDSTVNALPGIIKILKDQGFKMVPISRLLSPKREEIG